MGRSRGFLSVENWDKVDLTTPSFDAILNQLGQISSNTTPAVDRGILILTNCTSWIPDDPDGRSPMDTAPFVQQSVSYDAVDAYSDRNTGMRGSRSILMTLRGINVTAPTRNSEVLGIVKDPYILADPSLGNMFLVNIKKTKSAAKSLSSVITVLSSMAYYDQLPQSMTMTNAEQVYFVSVLYPQAVAGYAAVVVVALVHLILVAAIVLLFLKKTRLTLLGNCWVSIPQLLAPETEDLLRGSTFTTDEEVKRYHKRQGKDSNVKIRSRQESDESDQG